MQLVASRSQPGWKCTKGAINAYSPPEVDAIAQWLRDGHSAAQIAALLSKERGVPVTRNSIIGLVSRNDGLAAIGFARAPGCRLKVKRGRGPDFTPKPRRSQAKPRKPAAAKPVLVPVAPRATYDMASRHVPLAVLARNECRWPVNDAAVGEEHLFCGAGVKSGHSYCAHHAGRNSYRRAAA